jgi:hypothetical protein
MLHEEAKMQKLIACAILLTLCLPVIGWGQAERQWWGYVTDKATGYPVEDAYVYTTPPGGLDFTSANGFYNLCNGNGMVDGETYLWIHARKGLKMGKVYVNDEYYESDPPVRRDIVITIPED